MKKTYFGEYYSNICEDWGEDPWANCGEHDDGHPKRSGAIADIEAYSKKYPSCQQFRIRMIKHHEETFPYTPRPIKERA